MESLLHQQKQSSAAAPRKSHSLKIKEDKCSLLSGKTKVNSCLNKLVFFFSCIKARKMYKAIILLGIWSEIPD